jgi:adenylate kinase
MRNFGQSFYAFSRYCLVSHADALCKGDHAKKVAIWAKVKKNRRESLKHIEILDVKLAHYILRQVMINSHEVEMNIIIIGIQGSGKGTQAALLREKYGWPHINMGNLLRDHINRHTTLGETAQHYIEQGHLVPDELVIQLVTPELDAATEGFVLDGFPRNLVQERYLLENYTIDGVILLELDDEISVRRISARRHCSACGADYNMLSNAPAVEGVCDICGGQVIMRNDDHPDAIRVRLEKFHQKTRKVIELFKERGIAIEIDANQPMMTVHQEIIKHLKLA